MALDPSIYGQIQPPPNPLAMAGQAVGISNALAQGRLLQNENQLFQSRTAAGQLVGQAIDPQTGQFDPRRYNALVAGANLGPAAMEALQGGNAAAIGQNQAGITGQQLSQEKIRSYQSHLGLLAQVLSPLAAPDAKPTKNDAYKAAADLISNPDLDAESKKEILGQTVQYLGGLSDDPTQIKQAVKGLQLRVQDAQSRLAAITGQTSLASNGAALVPVNVNNYAGSVTPANGQPITLQRSPEARAGLVPSVGPKGEPGVVPSSTVIGDAPVAPQAPAAPGAPQAPGGFHQTGLAAGTPESMTANADQAARAQEFANGAPNRVALIKNLKDVSDQFGGGPLADIGLKARQLGVQLGILPKGAAASQEEFNKMALQLAQQQRQALGGHGTDAQTDIALHANPNQGMTQEARSRVLAMLQGNEDAISGRNAVWQSLLRSGKAQPQDWGQFTADFNKRFDERAFQYQHMTQQQQKLLRDGMSADDRKRFDASRHFADWVRGQATAQ